MRILNDLIFHAPWRLLAVPSTFILVVFIGVAALRAERQWRRTRFISERVFTGDLLHLGQRAAALSFLGCTLMLFALAWAEPVLVSETTKERWGGIRVTYLPDVSLSMDARDVPEGNGTTSRIAMVRAVLARMEKSLAVSDDRVQPQAVIPFAGSAHRYGGFTESRTHLRELFSVIATGTLITTGGSDIVGALQAYRELLDEYPTPNEVTDIAIVLSDGGNDPGGHVINVGALDEVLRTLYNRATIIAVGFGGDSPVEIPYMLPDGTWDGVLRREQPNDASRNLAPNPYDDIVDEIGRTMRPRDAKPKRPTGDPWVTAFDEELMLLIAGDRGACIRIIHGETPSSEGKHCQRVKNVEDLHAHLVAIVRARGHALPPLVHRGEMPVERYFVAAGIGTLFLSLFFERMQALFRSQRKRPMRELLFDRTAE